MPVVYREEPWYSRPIPLGIWVLLIVAGIGTIVIYSANQPNRMTPVQQVSAQPELECVIPAVSPNGKYSAVIETYTTVAKRESRLRVASAPGREELTITVPTQERICDVAVNSAGCVAISSDDGRIWHYSLQSTKKGLTAALDWQHPSGAPRDLKLHWGENGRLYVTTTSEDYLVDGRTTIVQRWSNTGKKEWEYRSEPASPPNRKDVRRTAGAIIPLKDSVLIAGQVSYTYDQHGPAWCEEVNFQTKKVTKIWKQTDAEVAGKQTPIRPSAMTLSADGKTIYVGTTYGGVVVLDRTAHKPARIYQVLSGQPVWHIAASPNDDGIAVSPGGNEITYSNLNGDLGDAGPRKQRFLSEGRLFGLGFSAAGRTIIGRTHGEAERFDLP